MFCALSMPAMSSASMRELTVATTLVSAEATHASSSRTASLFHLAAEVDDSPTEKGYWTNSGGPAAAESTAMQETTLSSSGARKTAKLYSTPLTIAMRTSLRPLVRRRSGQSSPTNVTDRD